MGYLRGGGVVKVMSSRVWHGSGSWNGKEEKVTGYEGCIRN